MNDLTLSTPGVKIVEQQFNQPTIAGVETAIPLFIGPVTNAADPEGEPLFNALREIDGFPEFVELYGVPPLANPLNLNVVQRVGPDNVSEVTVTFSGVTPTVARTPQRAVLFYQMMEWYYQNQGGRCFVVGLDPDSGTLLQDYRDAIAAAEREPDITLIVATDTIGPLPIGDYGDLVHDALQSCVRLKDRFVIADLPGTGPGANMGDAADAFRPEIPSNAGATLRYGALYGPMLQTAFGIHYSDDEVIIAPTSERIDIDDAGLETPAPLFAGGATPLSDDSIQGLADGTPGNSAVKSAVEDFLRRNRVFLPPSPAMAGLYALNDAMTGVHKTPANMGIARVVAPAIPTSDAEQGPLNVDPASGKSVNVIRTFPVRGTLVWGGRTLDGNGSDYAFIGPRRYAIYLETSIKLALTPFTFEPNVPKTWSTVKGMIEGFLLTEWRAGRMAGPTPEGSFDVTIGLGTTMTQADLVAGRMHLTVRVAIGFPAEVIVLTFSQRAIGT